MLQSSLSVTSEPTDPRLFPCAHVPRCPAAGASDHAAARIVVSYPEQGWTLLCNGVVVFDDNGEILPNGTCTASGHADSYGLARAA